MPDLRDHLPIPDRASRIAPDAGLRRFPIEIRARGRLVDRLERASAAGQAG